MQRTYKKIKINKRWIDENIVKKSWQRSVYPSRVNRFAGYIREGNFKNSLITVSKNGRYTLLDGQHKLEAIKKEDAEFEMDFCIYEGLDEEQEIEIYRMLNEVKPFRVVDDIKTYIGRHDWLDAFFDKSFPIEITIHGGINSMKIGDVLIVLHGGLRTQKKRTSLSRNKLPMFLEDLDAEKFSLMKDFCSLYKKVFGSPHRDNWVYRNIVMQTIIKIWYTNKENFKEEEFIKRFRPIERTSSIRQISSSGGFDTTALEIMVDRIYKTINKGYSANKMKEFWKEE